MAKLLVEVQSSGITQTTKAVTQLDKDLEKLRVENLKLQKAFDALDKSSLTYTKDSAKLQQQMRLNASAVTGLTKANNSLVTSNAKVNTSSNSLTTSLKQLAGAYLSFQAVKELGTYFVTTADSMKLLDARLRLTTKSVEEYKDQQVKLLAISKNTYSSISDITTLYTKLNPALSNLGATTAQINEVVSIFTKGLQLGGASAGEASSAILQFSQAMGAGKLSGEEFNAIAEASPKLLEYLSKGLGVARGELKQMGADGKLTAETVSNALLKVSSDVDRDFKALPVTVSKALTNIQTEFSIATKKIDDTTGATETLSKSLTSFAGDIQTYTTKSLAFYSGVKTAIDEHAEGLRTTGNILTAVLVGYSAFYIGGRVIAGIQATTTAVLTLRASMLALSTTIPVLGWISAGIGVAAGAYLISQSDITKANYQGVSSLEDLNAELKKLEEQRLKVSSNKTAWDSDQKKEIAIIDANVEAVNKQIQALKDIAIAEEKAKKAKEEALGSGIKGAVTLNNELKKLLNPIDEITARYSDLFKNAIDSGNGTEANIKKLNDAMNDEIKALSKKSTVLTKSTTDYKDYYETLGMYSKSWALEEAKLRKEYAGGDATELEAFIAKKKQAYTDSFKVQKEDLTMSASDWKEYFILLGQYEYAWQIEQAETMSKFSEGTVEEFAKIMPKLKENFFDQFKKEKAELFNSDIDLDGFTSPVSSLLKVMDNLNKAQDKYNKYIDLGGHSKEEIAHADKENQKDLIKGYSNIAGAMSAMFNEGSKEAEAFQRIQAGLAMVSGVTAVLEQGKGDPYTSWARMATMAATVASVLSQAGIAFGGIGGSSESTSSDAFSSLTANTGTSTVLGDAEAQSESIINALSILEDFAQPQYQTLLSMNSYLKSIADNIGGVTSLLVQSGGFAFGEGYEGFDTGFSNNVSSFGLDKLNIFDALTGTDLMGGIINSVIGGLFGKTSVSQSLTDSGIYFADTLLTTATESILGKAYQTISTTTTKKSWFSKSSKTSVSTYFDELDAETNRQFSLVLDNLYQTTLLAGDALDSSAEATAQSLQNFVVSIGKISLKDLTGDEIQESLTAIFGAIGDDIAETAFPLLTAFQGVGEGMFETLTRVATGMEEAEYYINRLGVAFDDLSYTDILNKQGDVGFEALLQSIVKTDEATYGLNNNLVQIIGSLDSTAEELYGTYTSLDTLRDTLKFLALDVDAVSYASITGAGSLSALTSGVDSYIENFLTDTEQLSYATLLLQKEFNRLNIAMPTSKDGFTDLIEGLDLTSDAGQGLYGSIITLSESFADMMDDFDDYIEDLQDSLTSLVDDGFDTLDAAFSSLFSSIKSMAASTISAISSIKTSSSDEFTVLSEFNSLVAQFNASKLTTDTDATSALYSQVLSLGQTLAGDARYTAPILSMLESNLQGFESQEDILRVTLVDALGTTIGLTTDQNGALKTAISDGILTNEEIDGMSLTDTQKQALVTLGTNSNYFSTEATLSNLEEYSKLQLDAYRQSLAEETVGVSKKSFSYGDYIGSQEEIDIAKLTGLSGDDLASFITQAQSLSISNDPYADLSSMMGMTATSYNQASASHFKAIEPYLSGVRVADHIANIESVNASNIAAEAFEKAKADFYNRNTIATAKYQQEVSESNVAKDLFYSTPISKTASYYEIAENISTGTPFKRGGYTTYGNNTELTNSRYSSYSTEFSQAYSAYKTLQQLEQEKALKGYATGGYTGDGAKYDVAGLVHKGEYVVNQDQLRNAGGVGAVESFVNGGNKQLVSAMNTLISYTKSLLKENRDLTTLFKRVTNGGENMIVSLDA